MDVIVTIVGEDGELLEEEVVQKVSEYIQDESVKVLNEVVTVQNPIVNPYTVELSYTIAQDDINNMNEIQEAVQNAVLQYVKSQDSKIGGSINPYVLNQLVIRAGAFTVDITSPTLKQLTKQDIAKCTTTKITYTGMI